jgi:uncharacterized SAM-binding protein YcdF (DUF218 family)
MEIQDIAKFLINPLLYVFLATVLIIFAKRHKSKLALLLVVYFYLISIPFTGYVFAKMWRMNDTFKPDVIYDAVVVPAGVSNAYWHLDRDGLPYIPRSFFASEAATDKILAAIYFVRSGNARLILIGDAVYEQRKHGIDKTYDEGYYVKKLVNEMGLKENRLKIYGKVLRTLDEAEDIHQYMINHPMRNILFVTSEIDMRRTLAMFKKQGLNADIFSVNKEDMEITWEAFIPQTDGIIKTENCLYEFVAYIGYRLRGNS